MKLIYTCGQRKLRVDLLFLTSASMLLLNSFFPTDKSHMSDVMFLKAILKREVVSFCSNNFVLCK